MRFSHILCWIFGDNGRQRNCKAILLYDLIQQRSGIILSQHSRGLITQNVKKMLQKFATYFRSYFPSLAV